MLRIINCLAFAGLWFLAAVSLGANPSEELALLLQKSYDLPQESAEFTAEAERLANVLERNPIGAVAKAMVALGQLHQGNQEQAEAILKGFMESTGDSAAEESTREFARHWLTVLDREKVVSTLKLYYRDHIRYPNSLESLRVEYPSLSFPPSDRWGSPWRYELVKPRFFSNTQSQNYRVESTRLPDVNSVSAALAQKNGEELQWIRARRVVMRQRGVPTTVNFNRMNTSLEYTLAEGSGAGGYWFIAWEGDRLFISDGSAFRGVRPPE